MREMDQREVGESGRRRVKTLRMSFSLRKHIAVVAVIIIIF